MAKSKEQRVLDIHASNSSFLPSEIAFRADCSHAYVKKVLAKFNCEQEAEKPAVLQLNMPANGTAVHVNHNGKLIAVLMLSAAGLSLQLRRNAKPRSKPIPWKTMLAFQKLLE